MIEKLQRRTRDSGLTANRSGLNEDVTVLATLGYKQEFRRNFTALELFGFGFSIIGLLPSIASTLVFALPNGGPSAMVWGWATCTVFLVLIALAMAELGSAAPTSGGLYYWTFKYSSPKWRNLLSWIVGYSNTISNIAAVASIDWGCAVQIMAAVSIGSGLTFQPSTAQIFGVFAALLFCHATICSLATRVIARLQIPYIIFNVVLCFVIIIGLPAATPKEFMNTAKFAFGDFENFNGWPNGYAFILSFLLPLWTVGGLDSSVHISEEANNANVAVPFAIISSTVVSCVLGWGINVALAFCMGSDVQSTLDSSIGQPMATILFNSFGQRGTLAVWAVVVVVQFMMGSSSLTATSRQTFAFSRDGGLPFSRFLYRINRFTGTPVNCVWASAFCALLLGLLAFGGSNAIGAVFSSAVAGQYVAFSIPIAARFLGGKHFKPGPFWLGRFGLPVAATAVLWMTFMTIVFLFPTTPSTSAAEMNYTVVVLPGVISLAVLYYYFPTYGGATFFKGPIANIEYNELESETEINTDKEENISKETIQLEK